MIGDILCYINPYLSIPLALIIIYFTRQYLRNRKYKLPPGLWALPIIGNYKEALGNLGYIRWANELRKQYGDVFLIYMGNSPMIVVNNYDTAVEAFVTKYPKELSGRPFIKIMHEFSEKSQDIIMASYGPRWKHQRKVAHNALRKFMQGLNVEVANINSFNKFSEDLKLNEPIELIEPLYHLTMNVICGVLFSETYAVTDKEFDEVAITMKDMNKEFLNIVYLEILPFLWNFPLPSLRKIKYLINRYLNYMQRKVQEHQDKLSEDPRDVCDCLLLELREDRDENQALNEVHIRQILSDLVLAATDTSRGTLHWLIGLLASYPDIQEKIFHEISTHKQSLPVGNDGVSLDWKQHLPYTNATINEVFRYSTIVPRGAAHTTIGDCKIGGYDVPKGYDVVLNHYAFHYDPKYWTDPHKFNPQRFLDQNGKLIPKAPGLAPFGFGHRVCLGESVAKADIFLLTVLLCSHYEFVWYEGNKDKVITLSSDSTFEQIPNPFKVIFKKRN